MTDHICCVDSDQNFKKSFCIQWESSDSSLHRLVREGVNRDIGLSEGRLILHCPHLSASGNLIARRPFEAN